MNPYNIKIGVGIAATCYALCALVMPYRFGVINTALYYFFASFRSNIWHTLTNKYNQMMIAYKKVDKKLYNKNVILFVHGRNGCYTDFKPFVENIKKHYKTLPKDELVKKGYDKDDIVIILANKEYVLRAVDLKNTDYTSIDEDTRVLADELRVYVNCNIIFLALSKGGLVVMRYATKFHNSKNNNIKIIITISSPLKGTEITILFSRLSPVRLALGYNSVISKEIDSDRKKLKDITICHIVPEYDCLVIPTSSAMYDDTDNKNIYYHKDKKYGHGGMMYCEEVMLVIINWITLFMSQNN